MNQDIFILGKEFGTFVRSVAIVCEEKGITYEVSDRLDGHPVALRSTALKALHPFGKIPVVFHGGEIFVESAPTLRYLDRTFAPQTLQGQGEREYFLCDQWSQLVSVYVDRYLIRDFMLELAFPQGADGQPRMDVVENGRPAAQEAIDVLAKQLADKPYLVAETFTLADALLAPILLYNSAMPSDFNLVSRHSELVEYAGRLRQRPSIQRMLVRLDAAVRPGL